jgi:hypothetical protein
VCLCAGHACMHACTRVSHVPSCAPVWFVCWFGVYVAVRVPTASPLLPWCDCGCSTPLQYTTRWWASFWSEAQRRTRSTLGPGEWATRKECCWAREDWGAQQAPRPSTALSWPLALTYWYCPPPPPQPSTRTLPWHPTPCIPLPQLPCYSPCPGFRRSHQTKQARPACGRPCVRSSGGVRQGPGARAHVLCVYRGCVHCSSERVPLHTDGRQYCRQYFIGSCVASCCPPPPHPHPPTLPPPPTPPPPHTYFASPSTHHLKPPPFYTPPAPRAILMLVRSCTVLCGGGIGPC